jgi:hypothetical protein
MLQNVSGPYFKVPEQVSLESIIFSHYETLWNIMNHYQSWLCHSHYESFSFLSFSLYSFTLLTILEHYETLSFWNIPILSIVILKGCHSILFHDMCDNVWYH